MLEWAGHFRTVKSSLVLAPTGDTPALRALLSTTFYWVVHGGTTPLMRA